MPLTPTRELVLKKLHDCFPDPDAADAALAILDTYGTEKWHREKDRVHLALLKVSAGKLDDLRRNVHGAQTDYRDTLVAAEFLGEWMAPAHTSAEQLLVIAQADRAKYEAWLRSGGA